MRVTQSVAGLAVRAGQLRSAFRSAAAHEKPKQSQGALSTFLQRLHSHTLARMLSFATFHTHALCPRSSHPAGFSPVSLS